jgi:hypothetical protein
MKKSRPRVSAAEDEIAASFAASCEKKKSSIQSEERSDSWGWAARAARVALRQGYTVNATQWRNWKEMIIIYK